MAAKKLTVVISQSQRKNPAMRHLEEELAAALIMDADVEVSLVPHLYDLTSDHTGTLFLRSVPGDLVVLAWLYPRSSHWILDRNGVKGHTGQTMLERAAGVEDDDEPIKDVDPPKGIGALDVARRNIYCLDLRDQTDHRVYLEEIHRIAKECSVQTVDLGSWLQGSPKPEQLERFLYPEEQLGSQKANGKANSNGKTVAAPKRRWYPVIDYDRCTNCMECIDFCLFGVYGIDKLDRILVEEQDNCKKGCPACSRVCPENAIVFPGHKSPAIAGDDGEVGSLKIDLSKLFGAPNAMEVAARERDLELVKDGRTAVGLNEGVPRRHSQHEPETQDELDDLLDGLNGLDF